MSQWKTVSRITAVLLVLALCLPAAAPAATLAHASDRAPNRVVAWFQSSLSWVFGWIASTLEELEPVIAPEHGTIVP